MGILNKKERVFDVIVTEEGKRQLATGEFKITFASFTDKDVFYQADLNNVQDNANSRLYFETFNKIQDQIIFELDSNGGGIKPFKAGEFNFTGNKILTSSMMLTGTAVHFHINDALDSQISNFKNQYFTIISKSEKE